MKKTKEELKEEVMESAQDCESTEEPVEDVDYDAKIEHCRSKLVVLDIFYKEKKSELENEIKELQEKRDMEESVKALKNFISRLVEGGLSRDRAEEIVAEPFISRLVEGGLSRDRAEEIVAEYVRKIMGLGSTEKKRVSYVNTDRGSFISVADKMAGLFGSKE